MRIKPWVAILLTVIPLTYFTIEEERKSQRKREAFERWTDSVHQENLKWFEKTNAELDSLNKRLKEDLKSISERNQQLRDLNRELDKFLKDQ